MTTTHDVPMPRPWQTKTVMSPNLYTADQLRAYADARCAKLQEERDALEVRAFAWRRSFIAERAKWHLDEGAKIEQSRILAETDARMLEAAFEAAGDQP